MIKMDLTVFFVRAELGYTKERYSYVRGKRVILHDILLDKTVLILHFVCCTVDKRDIIT